MQIANNIKSNLETENKVSLHPLIEKRKSYKAFSEQAVEKEKIQSILEAAQLAPSCFNEQPWNFIIGNKYEDEEQYNKILNCFNKDNQVWAKHAPILMITVAKLFFTHNGAANPYAWHDLGLSVANMTFQANYLDLCVSEVAGIVSENIYETFNISEVYQPCSGLVIGYQGNGLNLLDNLQKKNNKPRIRNPIDSFVYYKDFNPANLEGEKLEMFKFLASKIKFNSLEELYKLYNQNK